MISLLDFTKSLVLHSSTKDNPDQLEVVLAEAGKALTGFKYKKFVSHGIPSILYYNTPKLPEKFKVILNAHLDVVAAKDEQYHLVEKDGKLYGRGVIDMKAAAAAEILAFAQMAKKVNYPIGLQLVTDEEIGGHNGTKFQISQGVLTDFYLCGEYSDLSLGCDTKGVLWLKMITKGIRAHGAYVWNGVNAVTKLAQEIQAVGRVFPIPAKAVWKTTCNFGVISGGNTVNQVPDQASVTLDIRHIPEDKSTDIISKIKSRLFFPDTILQIMEDEPVNHADQNHLMVKKLAKSVKLITGKSAKYTKFNGASDARHYSAVGATALDIGPTGAGLHSDNEWVDIKSLDDYYAILINFLKDLI